jgi:hypothetical protein
VARSLPGSAVITVQAGAGVQAAGNVVDLADEQVARDPVAGELLS